MMLHCAERDPRLHVLAERPHKSDTQQRPQKRVLFTALPCCLCHCSKALTKSNLSLK